MFYRVVWGWCLGYWIGVTDSPQVGTPGDQTVINLRQHLAEQRIIKQLYSRGAVQSNHIGYLINNLLLYYSPPPALWLEIWDVELCSCVRLTISCSWGWGWGWGLSLLCWPPLGLLRPTSSCPRPELRSRLKIFGGWKNISHFKSWKYLPTFPAAAPTWSEHPRPPSCPCLDCRHLALCQSHLKRTVTGPAIKMDKSQSTLLCLLSISQISTKIHSKLALLGP